MRRTISILLFLTFGIFNIYAQDIAVPNSEDDVCKQAKELYDKGLEYAQGGHYIMANLFIQQAAEMGNANAQGLLGLYYEYGLSGTKDYSLAMKWYRKAAEQGYADAQFYLGVCYDFGYGVTQSTTEAVKWYRKAAEQGNHSAQTMLDILKLKGY